MNFLNEAQTSNDGLVEYASSDQMEIETIDEHNIHFITPQHYSILLKYIKLNDNFLVNPNNYGKLLKSMLHELNELGFRRDQFEWISIMHDWRDKIKQLNNELMLGNLLSMTAEYLEFWNLLCNGSATKSIDPQLSCLLDHLEVAGTSSSLWSTISLEMESFGVDENEEYWKNVFEKWCNDVKKKKKLHESYDAKNSYSTEPPNIFTALEQRLLVYLNTDSTHFDINDEPEVEPEIEPEIEPEYDVEYLKYCRTCLNQSNEMSNIFEAIDNVTWAEKIGLCSYISPIERDDGFPQNICVNCIKLLESAFKFKTICEKADCELRSFPKEIIKENTSVEAYRTDKGDNKVYVVTVDGEAVELLEDVQENMSMIGEGIEENVIYGEDGEEINQQNEDDDPNDPDYLESFINDEEIEEIEEEDEITNDSLNCEEKLKSAIELVVRPDPKTEQLNQKLDESGIIQCGVCDGIFENYILLKEHSKIHKTKVKSHDCSYCTKQFKTKISLKIHIRSHTGERPYVCETCGKAFKTVSAVNNHRAIHSGVKSFQCPLCPYSACTKANLRIHDRTHSGVQPYACKYCDLKFSTASNMQKHVRNIHHKMKNHKCTQCSRSFFTRESVRKHMVTHTGLKPYGCPECPTAYGWYNGLQKHMKMQHCGVKIPTEKSYYPNDDTPSTNSYKNNEKDTIIEDMEIIHEPTDDSQGMTIVFIKNENNKLT